MSVSKHQSLKVDEPMEEKESPCAKKTDTIHEQLQKIREQVDLLDLTGVYERLDRIELQIVGLTEKLAAALDLKFDLDQEEHDLMLFMKKTVEERK